MIRQRFSFFLTQKSNSIFETPYVSEVWSISSRDSRDEHFRNQLDIFWISEIAGLTDFWVDMCDGVSAGHEYQQAIVRLERQFELCWVSYRNTWRFCLGLTGCWYLSEHVREKDHRYVIWAPSPCRSGSVHIWSHLGFLWHDVQWCSFMMPVGRTVLAVSGEKIIRKS
jgi:hypothetical protein